ncbi:MAG: hypothetical protein H6712_24925 [Myxococcales bacterium]|nr:hypothetical protein [Myxococcales bacterium]MCB9717123.1 hypothetical protein [Myxococcales bacterium]
MPTQWIQGVDLSNHQGKVDMKTLAEEGHMAFVIVKCTEGADFVDPSFKTFWKQLVGFDVAGDGPVHLLRGAYHFARPDNRGGRAGGEKEAKWFCKTMKAAGSYDAGALPPALDWEKWTDTDAETRRNNVEWVRGWLDVVQSELGRKGMIYTGVNVWSGTTGNSDDFVDYPLWNVKYKKTGDAPPRIPKSSKKKAWPWTLWQWSGGKELNYYGKVPGVPGGVADVNRFNGDVKALLRLAKVRRIRHRMRLSDQPIA